MEWLRDKGYSPEGLLSFDDVGINAPSVSEGDKMVITVCLRMWLEEEGIDTSAVADEDIRALADGHMRSKPVIRCPSWANSAFAMARLACSTISR